MFLRLLFLLSFCPILRAAELPAALLSWLHAQEQVGDVRVDFRMTRSSPALSEPQAQMGHLYRVRDGRFRMEVGEPISSRVLFDGSQLHLWELSQQKWRSFSATHPAAQVWALFGRAGAEQVESLTQRFTCSVVAEDKLSVRLNLIPRSSTMRKQLAKLELLVPREGPRLLELRMVMGDGGMGAFDFQPPTALTAADIAAISFKPQPPSP